MNAGDDSGRKAAKSKEFDRFMVQLVLSNVYHERFRDMSVEYSR